MQIRHILSPVIQPIKANAHLEEELLFKEGKKGAGMRGKMWA